MQRKLQRRSQRKRLLRCIKRVLACLNSGTKKNVDIPNTNESYQSCDYDAPLHCSLDGNVRCIFSHACPKPSKNHECGPYSRRSGDIDRCEKPRTNSADELSKKDEWDLA